MRCLLQKKPLLIIGLLFSLTMGFAQKHDNNWLWGRQIQYQDSLQYRVGNAQGNFSTNSMSSFSINRNMPFTKTGGFFSDNDGNLMLYSNGMQIKDTTGVVIKNGDSLNYGHVWDQLYSSMISGDLGFTTPRDLFFVKQPSVDSVFILLHELTGDASNNYENTINMTKIVRQSNGEFEVVSKNRIVSPYKSAYRNLSACMHGNGRDWWVLFTEDNTNCVVKLLLTPDTLIQYGYQCIGDTIAFKNGIKATFSLNGDKYSSTDAIHNGTNVFDFDRCSGELSSPFKIPPLVEYDTILGVPVVSDYVQSIDFSPNSRYMYVIMSFKIFQFDLNSPQFPNDYDTIAIMDDFIDSTVGIPYRFNFYASTYGPDGVLYISPGNYQRWLCTINNPNGKGDSCDFRLRNIELPKMWSFTSPNIPNYRLGRSIGSACDTVYSDVKPIYKETPWLKVYPNPATDDVRVDYNWVEWERILDCRLQILDLKGSVMHEQAVPRYSTRQDVNVKELPQGVYTVMLTATPKSPSRYERDETKGDFNSQQPIAVCKLTVVR